MLLSVRDGARLLCQVLRRIHYMYVLIHRNETLQVFLFHVIKAHLQRYHVLNHNQNAKDIHTINFKLQGKLVQALRIAKQTLDIVHFLKKNLMDFVVLLHHLVLY